MDSINSLFIPFVNVKNLKENIAALIVTVLPTAEKSRWMNLRQSAISTIFPKNNILVEKK